jgi:Holliday junction DNA helicase RuvA
MIAALTGTLVHKSPQAIVVDVHGVGYELAIPLSTYYALPALEQPVRLHVSTHLREDALSLFGFLTRAEKDLFLLLQQVSGVGPKLSLNILSGPPPADLADAIQRGDAAALAEIPGVGKKTSARLVLELKEKIALLQLPLPSAAGAPPPAGAAFDDAISALVNLGYKAQRAEEAVRQVARQDRGLNLDGMIRESLRILSR